MQLSLLSFVFLVVACKAADYLTEQPDYIPVCEIKKPEFTKCSTASIQKMFTKLKKGIPGVLKPIDPFEINKISLQQSGTNAANLKADLTKVKVKGFGDTIVTESKVSPKDYSWETRFSLPHVRIDGQYKLDGRVLLVPLKGNGDMFIEIDNMDVVMYTKTKLYEKGDFTFYNISSVKVEIFPGKVRTRFNNLFNGNAELENSTNDLFNANWQDFFEALKPAISETIEGAFLAILRRTFDYIPANFFISDIPKSSELYG